MDLVLTPEEIERYKPYHTMKAFEVGFADYGKFINDHYGDGGVDQQAYDRGAECAMRRRRRTELNPNYRGTGGLKSPDEPGTGDPEYRGCCEGYGFNT